MLDQNFDGVITLEDLQFFLRDTMKLDLKEYRQKVERLFKVLDLNKGGRIYQVDFEKVFSEAFESKGEEKPVRARSVHQRMKSAGGYVIRWQESCRDQIARYLRDNYASVEESFNCKYAINECF